MSDLVTKRGRPRKTPKQETTPDSVDEPIDIPILESEPEIQPEVKTEKPEKPVKPKKPAKQVKQVKPKTPIKKENESSVCVFKNPLTGKSEWIVDLRRPDCNEKMRITVEFQT